jgi:hypothetical protein
MQPIDVEVSDFEKHLTQKSIRRSVVNKEKLNWSSQFAAGSLSKYSNNNNSQFKQLEGVSKLFMDSRGASMAINSIKHHKPPLIGRNPHLLDLLLPSKQLTVILVS